MVSAAFEDKLEDHEKVWAMQIVVHAVFGFTTEIAWVANGVVETVGGTPSIGPSL